MFHCESSLHGHDDRITSGGPTLSAKRLLRAPRGASTYMGISRSDEFEKSGISLSKDLRFFSKPAQETNPLLSANAGAPCRSKGPLSQRISSTLLNDTHQNMVMSVRRPQSHRRRVNDSPDERAEYPKLYEECDQKSIE